MNRTYLEPTSLAEALAALGADAGDTALVAGGTDLVVGARSGKKPLPGRIVAIHRLGELGHIEVLEGGGLRLGALVSHAQMESSPLLRASYSAISDASELVGSPATRAAGTLGGNLSNASPAMETGSPLLVLGAQVELSSAARVRRLPLPEFLLGPGKTALQPGEMLTAVELQAAALRSGSAYVRLEYRLAMEIAVVGAAALISLAEDGSVAAAQLAITAAAPTCLLVPGAANALRGRQPDEATIAKAAAAAAQAASPIDDVRAPADYRRAMVEVMARRALEKALARARGEEGA